MASIDLPRRSMAVLSTGCRAALGDRGRGTTATVARDQVAGRGAGDLAALLDDLIEVAVWTSADGHLQEHASFLLRTGRDGWSSVGFGDHAANELVARLRTLPGFDTDLLFELLNQRVRRVVTLWSRPTS